jgi:hypothetical protein
VNKIHFTFHSSRKPLLRFERHCPPLSLKCDGRRACINNIIHVLLCQLPMANLTSLKRNLAGILRMEEGDFITYGGGGAWSKDNLFLQKPVYPFFSPRKFPLFSPRCLEISSKSFRNFVRRRSRTLNLENIRVVCGLHDKSMFFTHLHLVRP